MVGNRPAFPSRRHPLEVLYEDNHVIAVVKPGGVLVQGDRTGDFTLIDQVRLYLKEKYNKPGNVFVGLVHRIDRPVSGVVLFARTSKAASRLANAFRLRRTRKVYLAVVHGTVRGDSGELTGYVERAHLRSRLVAGETGKAKAATLHFRVLARTTQLSLLEVVPHTGRHHQIRLQLAAMGHPVAGDIKYGAGATLEDKTIALHSETLVVEHPTQHEDIVLTAPPPRGHPWSEFNAAIGSRSSPVE